MLARCTRSSRFKKAKKKPDIKKIQCPAQEKKDEAIPVLETKDECDNVLPRDFCVEGIGA